MNIWEDGENMKNIAKGIYNHHFKDETEMSKHKLSICNSCEFNKDTPLLGNTCQLCGCVIKYKVKSDSKCPDGKW